MNKKLRSVFAVFTALVMVLSFTACGKTDSDNKSGETGKKTESKADEAKKVADEFLKDISKFKFKDAAELMDEDGDVEDLSDVNGVDDLVKLGLEEANSAAGNLSQYGLADDFLEKAVRKAFGFYSIDYEITDAKEKDDKTVEVDFKIAAEKPDMKVLENPAEKYASEMQQYAESLAGSLSASPTEEEKAKLTGKVIEHVYDLAFDDIEKNLIKDDIKGTFVLEEKDGKWIIIADDSDLDDIANWFEE